MIGGPIGGIIPVQINGTATATLDDVTLTATGTRQHHGGNE